MTVPRNPAARLHAETQDSTELGSLVLLRKFVSLQAELLKAWLLFHPGALDPWASRRLPRHGELIVRGECWHFHRQGVGVDFQGQDSRRMVDVHRGVAMPQVFDAWRLMLYFESISVSTLQVGSREFPTDDERLIELWLAELETLGLVEKDRTEPRLWRLAATN